MREDDLMGKEVYPKMIKDLPEMDTPLFPALRCKSFMQFIGVMATPIFEAAGFGVGLA